MKQVIRKGLKDIIVDEVPDPALLPHHVLVRPLYSLISSGTETASIHRDSLLREVADNPSYLRKIWDVAMKTGPVATIAEVRAKFTEYAVLGYSGAGVVAARHATVTDLEIGERVAYGGEGTGHGETILVGRNLAARMPQGVAFEHACFATLGSIAMNAVRTARIELGDVVAVIGLGLVGQLVAQLVRLQGGVVVGIDLNGKRVDMARALGADHGIAGASALEAVRGLTNGRGVDCAIVAAASKSPAPAQHALSLCRDRGRICIVGAVGMEFPWNDMYLKEIQLYMSRAYGPGSYDASYEKQGRDYPLPYVRWTENRNMEEFLRLIAAGRIDVRPLITHEFLLDDAAKGYDTIFDPSAGSLAVLLRYPAASAADPVAAFAPVRRVATPGQARAKAQIEFALVGAGNLAKWEHLPNLKKLPGVGLRAVYSAAGARGKSYALRFGAAYACSEYEEVLRDPQVDAVLIASRNQHHAAQSLAALRAGKHVFVEKPMALTAQECRELCAAVEESGKHLTVGFNRRFAPYYRELKQTLERRNSPAVLQCRINSPGISGSYWMADPAIGGAILGEACHFIDLMYWLLGSEPLSVSAYSLPTGKADPIGENNLVASFRFADGSIGNLTYCTVGSKTSGGERVEVFAQGVGAFTEDFKRVSVHKGMHSARSRMWPDKGYGAQMADFAASIKQGRQPAVTVYDGARATLGCLCHDGLGPRWGTGRTSTMTGRKCSIVGQLLNLRAGWQRARPAAYQHAAGYQPTPHEKEHLDGRGTTPGQIPMKVVQLGPYPPPHGGVQTNLVAIRQHLRSNGHSCDAVNLTRFRRPDADGVYYPVGAAALMRLLWRLPADILHLHFGGDLTPRLLGLAFFCTLLPGRKTVLTFHSGGYPGSPAGQTAAPATLRGFVLRRLDGLIGVNAEITALFSKFGARPKRIRTILPFAVQPPDRSLPLPERLSAFLNTHSPALLTVAQLEPEYDLAMQIDAMAGVLQRFPRAGLLIAGSGSLEESLRARIAATPYRDHVLLYGDMPHVVTLRATLECDLLLRTTLYDGDSISVREALYIGTPVIATDNGMRPDGVHLIPPANPERLRDALCDLLSRARAPQAPAGDGQENIRAVLQFYQELLR